MKKNQIQKVGSLRKQKVSEKKVCQARPFLLNQQFKFEFLGEQIFLNIYRHSKKCISLNSKIYFSYAETAYCTPVSVHLYMKTLRLPGLSRGFESKIFWPMGSQEYNPPERVNQ